MVNSRNKGAQFERDVAKILNEFFEAEGIDYQTKRNLDQYQGAGQCDLIERKWVWLKIIRRISDGKQ